MKNLLPTKENLLSCLVEDTIGRNFDISCFYKILCAKNCPSSIAIDGRWGSGKTFFIKQTQLVLNALNNKNDGYSFERDALIKNPYFKDLETKNDVLTVYYDSWKNDSDEDPALSIIAEIANQVNEDFSLKNDDFISTTLSIMNFFSNDKINSLLNIVDANDFYTKFEHRKEIDLKIKAFFNEVLEERGTRLIIFIDELDRCEPNFAVRLLERIKHFFDDERIIFVFSINSDQLQQTIKKYYGSNFDSCNYLDRFFDFKFVLPKADMNKFYNHIGLNSNDSTDRVCKKISTMFGMELREMLNFYEQVNLATNKINDRTISYHFSEENGKKFILYCVVPLMIGLHTVDSTKFFQFYNGKYGDPLKELLISEELKYLLNNMLNKNESFIKIDRKILVSYEEIVDRVYDAIFAKEYSNGDYSTIMGDYEFTNESKKFACRAMSMFTNYSDLE